MNIRSLSVFHCFEPRKASNLLRELRKNVLVFRAESCARVVLIFCNLTTANLTKIKKINESLKKRADVCELRHGYDAYEFLLRWSVGLLNPKYYYNDRFVLGRLREHWTNFCNGTGSELNGSDFLKIIPALLDDAHQIRSIIKNKLVYLPGEDRIAQTKTLCHDYCLRREKAAKEQAPEFKFHHKIAQDIQRSSTTKVLKYLKKALAGFQQQASELDDHVKLKPEEDVPQQKIALIKTKLSITAAWEKRRILTSLSVGLDAGENMTMTSYQH